MKKLFYRTRQFFFSIAMNSVKKAPIVTQKNGAFAEIPQMIKSDGYKRAFIVTTKGFISRKTLDPLFSSLDQEGIPYSVFTGVVPDPDFDCVEKGAEMYRQNGGVIVAVGGGSVMDCAKMIGARAVKNKPLCKMKGVLKILKKLPPLYAVPTTSGTGSEVTVAAVLTDPQSHRKYAYEDFSLLPKRAVLDPSLTVGLSPYMTAATGMDALTHALEAYTNRFSSRFVKKASREATVLIFENLEKACKDGDDINARENLMRASMLAGRAINRGFVGYVHSAAHGIGGMYGVPHGEACAVLLTKVLRLYGKHAEKTLSELAKAVGLDGSDREELANKFISEIESLRENIGLPSGFKCLSASDIPNLTSGALREANPLYPVPEIWGEEKMRELFLLCEIKTSK